MAKKTKEKLEELTENRREILEQIISNLYTSNYLESNLDNINLKIILDYYLIINNKKGTMIELDLVVKLLTLDEWRQLWKYNIGYSNYQSRSESLQLLENIVKEIK